MNIKITSLTNEDVIFIELVKVITNEKNEIVEVLYKIEKNEDKAFKNIKKYIENNVLRDALKIYNDLEKNIKIIEFDYI